MTRIASFVQHQALLAELLRSNQNVFKTQMQITTGKVATHYKDIARDTGVLLSAKRVELRTEQFQRTNRELVGRLEHQNVVLEQITAATQGLREAVLNAVSLDSGAALMESVDSAFRQAVSVLNSQLDGRYVFGGTRVEQPPLNAGSLADLMAAPAIADVFGNNTRRLSVEIDDGRMLDYSFLADEVGQELLGIVKRMAEFNAGPNGPFGETLTSAQRGFLVSEIPNLKTAAENLNIVVARNGRFQAEVDDVIAQHESTNIFVKSFISDIEDVDLAEAVSRLTQDQVATEAAARVLSGLRQLSLLDFI